MENKVRSLRLKYDLTQEELANACGISRSTVAEVEGGRVPTGDVMLRFSHFFNEDARVIFPGVRVLSTVQEVYERRKLHRRGAKAGTQIACQMEEVAQ